VIILVKMSALRCECCLSDAAARKAVSYDCDDHTRAQLTETEVNLTEEELACYPRENMGDRQQRLEVVAREKEGNLAPYFCRKSWQSS
jgi:hypothetical protein